MKTLKLKISVFFLGLMIVACGTAKFDQRSLDGINDTKADAVALVNVSDENFNNHAGEAAALEAQINEMVDYEKTKSNNDISIKMWEYLNNDDSSLQEFLDLWEENGTLSPAFKQEYRPQIEELFDLMADYEKTKSEQSRLKLIDIIM